MDLNDPGKYDDTCTVARESTDAECVILMVVKGKLGSGFSIQATNKEVLLGTPDILEHVAKEIRADIARKFTS